VIVLAAEVLAVSHRFLEDHIHPTVIIGAYRQALEDAVTILREKIAFPVDVNDEKEMIKVSN
jgi:T-complex protein 1 subunit gamma